MSAINLPPEVIAECVSELSRISVEISRDGATLHRFVVRLLTGGSPGLLLGSLKKYARANKQYGADKVEEVIAAIEAVADPDHLKHLARCQARRDKEHAAFLERCKEPGPNSREITAVREKVAKLPHNGNVISGPWGTAG